MSEEESIKKILIITYYWPPSGGSGVQRWLKFVKYLPQFGVQPFVFTPENPSFDLKDESLLRDVPPEAEVLHFPIWEPYALFNRISGKKQVTGSVSSTQGSSWFQQLSVWIRGNIFVPDPRVFWVRPSVQFLDDFVKEQKIRAVITTGPPHSVHLIGLKLKKRNPSLKWIADFRDPWSEWGFLDSIKVGALARAVHKKLERKVLQQADKVLTITPFYVKHFERLGGRKVNLLTNGYDEDDFKNLKVQRQEKFIIRHVGIVNEKCNPVPFMEAVASLCESNESFKQHVQIDFVGNVNPVFESFVNNHSLLKSVTTFTATLPHKEVIELYGRSTVLLLVLTGYKDAEGYMPGKLFEYVATGLPILGIGPEEGDAAKLLQESKAGVMVESNDSGMILSSLLKLYHDWQKGVPDLKNLSMNYSRKAITGQLVELF